MKGDKDFGNVFVAIILYLGCLTMVVYLAFKDEIPNEGKVGIILGVIIFGGLAAWVGSNTEVERKKILTRHKINVYFDDKVARHQENLTRMEAVKEVNRLLSEIKKAKDGFIHVYHYSDLAFIRAKSIKSIEVEE